MKRRTASLLRSELKKRVKIALSLSLSSCSIFTRFSTTHSDHVTKETTHRPAAARKAVP